MLDVKDASDEVEADTSDNRVGHRNQFPPSAKVAIECIVLVGFRAGEKIEGDEKRFYFSTPDHEDSGGTIRMDDSIHDFKAKLVSAGAVEVGDTWAVTVFVPPASLARMASLGFQNSFQYKKEYRLSEMDPECWCALDPESTFQHYKPTYGFCGGLSQRLRVVDVGTPEKYQHLAFELISAAHRESSMSIERLLGAGADSTWGFGPFEAQKSAIQIAVEARSCKLVQVFLDSGADISRYISDLLLFAGIRGWLDMAKILRGGIDPQQRTEFHCQQLSKLIREVGPSGPIGLDIYTVESSTKFHHGRERIDFSFLGAGPRTRALGLNWDVPGLGHSDTVNSKSGLLDEDIYAPLVDKFLPTHAPLFSQGNPSDFDIHTFLAPVPWCRQVVEALAKAPNLDSLGTIAAQAIIEHAWAHIATLYCADCMLAMLYALLVFSVTSKLGSDKSFLLETIVLLVLTAKDFVETLAELRDMCKRGERPSRFNTRLYNVMVALEVMLLFAQNVCSSLMRLGVDCYAIALLFRGDHAGAPRYSPLGRSVLAVWCAAHWVHILSMLRGFHMFGPQILPMFAALSRSFVFFLILLFFFIATVNAYIVLGVLTSPTKFIAAFIAMYRLNFLGDFDLFHLEGVDTVFVPAGGGVQEPVNPDPSPMYYPVHALFVIASLSVSVLLMNLFIGVLGTNYSNCEGLGVMMFYQERAKIINRYCSRCWLRRCPKRVARLLPETPADHIETRPPPIAMPEDDPQSTYGAQPVAEVILEDRYLWIAAVKAQSRKPQETSS